MILHFSYYIGTVTLCSAGSHGLEVEDPQSTGVWHGAECWHGGVVSCFIEQQHPGLRDISATERGEITYSPNPVHPIICRMDRTSYWLTLVISSVGFRKAWVLGDSCLYILYWHSPTSNLVAVITAPRKTLLSQCRAVHLGLFGAQWINQTRTTWFKCILLALLGRIRLLH